MRHGATEWTETRQHTGRTDVPLTDEGDAPGRGAVQAARPAGVRGGVHQPARSGRARPPASPGFADAEVLDDLREWDYGVYEGRTTAEIREEIPGWSVWSDPDRRRRVARRRRRPRPAACSTGSRAVDGRVVLFAHAHVLRILTACAVGLEPRAGQVLALDAASISRARSRARLPRDPPLEPGALTPSLPRGSALGVGEKRGVRRRPVAAPAARPSCRPSRPR